VTQFLQVLLIGVGTGAIYALLAIGFVVIYKSTLVINFAQPALMIAGGLATSILVNEHGWPFWVAMLGGMVVATVIGLVSERVALRPMVGKPVFVAAIVTLGLDAVIRNIENRIIGPFPRPTGDPWGLDVVRFGGVIVQERYLWMIAITAVLVTALFAFFKYSRIGLAMRATAFDQEVALAQGISVGTVFALSWAIAGALAAVAGVFVGTGGSGLEQTTFVVGFKALPAIILGGLDSIGGAVIGGLAVGIVEAMVATYQGGGAGQCCGWLGSNFSTVAPYVLMLLVLLVKPYGLFGTPEVERV
jgi:branched-chain amino acid transport system permease protein